MIQGHRTGKSQTSVRMSVTRVIVERANAPHAATMTLSRNYERETWLPHGVVQIGWPCSGKFMVPKRRIKSHSQNKPKAGAPGTEQDAQRDVAMPRPLIGMAPCLSHTLPNA